MSRPKSQVVPETSHSPGSNGTSQGNHAELLKDEYDYDYLRFTHDYFEYEQGQKHIIVRGRLKQNIQFWKLIWAYSYVIDIIENGYKIPLYSEPPPTVHKNNKSARVEQSFVSEAIQDLLDCNLIEQCNEQPYIVNPLTVFCAKLRQEKTDIRFAYSE